MNSHEMMRNVCHEHRTVTFN